MTTRRGTGWRALLARFWRREDGAYSLEFAICAVPFFGLVLAFAEASYCYYFTDALQQAVQQAARAITTGEAQANYGSGSTSLQATTAAEFAKNYICSSTGIQNAYGTNHQIGTDTFFPAYLNCANLIIDLRAASSFTNAGTTANAVFYNQPTQYCLGAASTIRILRVAYPLPAIFPLSIFGSVGTVTDAPTAPGTSSHIITAVAAFQNEPYTTADNAPC